MSIKVMSRVWDDADVADVGELVVLLALADHADDDGVCWPSIRRLAERSRCSRSTVFRILERLRVRGLVCMDRGRGRGNVNLYQINVNGLNVRSFNDDLKGVRSHVKGVTARLKGVSSDTQNRNGKNRHKEPSHIQWLQERYERGQEEAS